MIVSVVQFQYFFLALVRVLAILVNIPILGGRMIPMQVRAIFGVLFTILLLPWQPMPADFLEMSLFTFTVAMIRELIIGIIAGFAALLTFAALQITGEMIGFTTGFNSGRVLNPAFGDSGSTVDQFFVMLSLLFLMAINGHHTILLAIQRTFTLIPINSPFITIPIDQVLTMTSGLINSGIQLALPAVGALLLTDVTLGFLAKVSPQIQVFFLGIPLKIGLGFFALMISLSLFYPSFIELLDQISDRMLKLLGA